MARTKKINIDDVEYTLQSVTFTWYSNLADKYLNNGRRNTAEYVDKLIKGCVVSPIEVANQGVKYFDDIDDLITPQELSREIENFLSERPKRQ